VPTAIWPGARRPSRIARRSSPGAGRPAPRPRCALVADDQATGPRLSTEIARLSTGRTTDSSTGARPTAPAAPPRWSAVVSLSTAALCIAIAAWPGAGHLWAFVWLLLGAIVLMMSKIFP
jgi:hypothetical protein